MLLLAPEHVFNLSNLFEKLFIVIRLDLGILFKIVLKFICANRLESVLILFLNTVSILLVTILKNVLNVHKTFYDLLEYESRRKRSSFERFMVHRQITSFTVDFNVSLINIGSLFG